MILCPNRPPESERVCSGICSKGCRNWIFGFEYVCGGIKEKFTVQQLTEIPIKRHIKIKCEANPFDPSWDEYFERRKLKSARQRA